MSNRNSTETSAVVVGARFVRLLVIGRTPKTDNRPSQWLCRCDCGNKVESTLNALRMGRTKSCGCLRAERWADRVASGSNTTHGFCGTPTYRVWRNMLNRCTNSSVPGYQRYGGRGIKVCDRWRGSFENFLADMGEAPDGLTIERDDVNGDYEPSNCRWATQVEQQNNRRNNVRVEYEGESLTLAQWDRRLGFSGGTVRYRLAAGWSTKDAITKPSRLSPYTHSR